MKCGWLERKKMNYSTFLPDKVLKHSKSVADVMYQLSSDMAEEMYVLGLLHDIGKIYGHENHEQNGYMLMESLGFKYSKEILYHGKMQTDYKSKALDILNAADLSVDSEGNIIGYKNRIEDIGSRYGYDSDEYCEAIKLSKTLLPIVEQIEVK